MSPKDYGFVKTHHIRSVASAKQALATDLPNPVLRRKLAVELLELRSLRSHWDLNTYLTKPTRP